jgi:integrase
VTAYPAYYPAVAFMAYTGARRGEALAIRWSDLHLEGGFVVSRRSLGDTKGSLAFKAPKNVEHRQAQEQERRDGDRPSSIMSTHKKRKTLTE